MPWNTIFHRASPQLSNNLLLRTGSNDALDGTFEFRRRKQTTSAPIRMQAIRAGKSWERLSNDGGSVVSVQLSLAEQKHEALVDNFCEAASNSDQKVLRSLLKDDPVLVNAHDQVGKTAIHYAALSENIDTIQLLARANADLNLKDDSGNTALHLAIENKVSQNVIAELLALGANPQIQNHNLDTALHFAVRQSSVDVLQVLLSSSLVEVNIHGSNGETPLHIAAALNNVEKVDLLLRHGARINSTCFGGLCPIHIAAARGSQEVLQYFLTPGRLSYGQLELLSFVDDENATALHAAVYGGNAEIVRLLLKNNANLKAQTQDKTTPFHLACSQGAIEIVDVVFEVCSRDVAHQILFMKDGQGHTPLHRSVMFDHVKLVSKLVREGAPVNTQDFKGRTALVLAAERAAYKSVVELLSSGANPTIHDNEGRNFLHMVVLVGGEQTDFSGLVQDAEMFVKLLNEKDKHGHTPLHYAARGGLENFSQQLVQLGASVNTRNEELQSPLHFAASCGGYSTVKKLIESAADGVRSISYPDRFGRTPLHLACEGGHFKIAKLLITSGAQMRKDHEGKTALHHAVKKDHQDIAQLLVQNYSYLANITDKHGNTPLHTAAENNSSESAYFLLNYGAAFTKNHNGATPLDLATMSKHQEVAAAMVRSSRSEEVLTRPSEMYGWPVYGLIKELPEVMKGILDRSKSEASCHPLAKEFYTKYDFRILEPERYAFYPESNRKFEKPLMALQRMKQYRRMELLCHPVCKNYLDMKWTSYGIYFHFLSLLLYAIFLGMLTYLILHGVKMDLTPHLIAISAANVLKYANASTVSQVNNRSYYGPYPLSTEDNLKHLPPGDTIFLCIILIFAGYELLQKLIQIIFLKFEYFLSVSNYFELVLYVSSIVFCFAFFDTDDTYISWQCQWIFGAIVGFFAWFNLINQLQRYGRIGIYVAVFFRELTMLAEVFCVYLVVLLGFAMAGCVLNPEKVFPDNIVFYQKDHGDDDPGDWTSAHTNLWSSLIRVCDMVVGEADVIDNYINPILTGELVFPNALYFLSLTTVGVVTILIQAILMGKVVWDLQRIKQSATLGILGMQIALHANLELRLPRRLVAKFNKPEITIFPNKSKFRVFRQFIQIFTLEDWEEDNNEEENEQLGKSIASNLSAQTLNLKNIDSVVDQQHELLRQVVKSIKVRMEADVMDDPAVAERRISWISIQNPGAKKRWKQLQNAQKVISALKRVSQTENVATKSPSVSTSQIIEEEQ